MVSSAENPSILVAVDQIHQKLFADTTNKARSMPTCVLTRSWSKNCHGSWADMITALQENEPGLLTLNFYNGNVAFCWLCWKPIYENEPDIHVVAWCFVKCSRNISQTVITYTLLWSTVGPSKVFIETTLIQQVLHMKVTPLYNRSLQRHLESASPLLGLKHLFFSVPQRFLALFSLHLSGHYRILPHYHMVEVVQWFACCGVFRQCCQCMEPFLLEGNSCRRVPEM